jgi:hypothetical protein
MNGPQSDTNNIMLASIGTTPLKIIYAGRLFSSFTFLEQLPMGDEQLPRASKYQRVRIYYRSIDMPKGFSH